MRERGFGAEDSVVSAEGKGVQSMCRWVDLMC